MPKEDNQDYVIIFCYALIVFFLISEPFVFQITNKEQTRMYGYILFSIGAIILGVILRKQDKQKKVVKNKNGM